MNDHVLSAGWRFPFDSVAYNEGAGNYSGGIWTVAEGGYYLITARIWMSPSSSVDNVGVFVNGTNQMFGTRSDDSPFVSGVLRLNARDQVDFRCQLGGTMHSGFSNSYASAHKIGN